MPILSRTSLLLHNTFCNISVSFKSYIYGSGQPPTFLTPGTGFMEDNFSMNQGEGGEGCRGAPTGPKAAGTVPSQTPAAPGVLRILTESAEWQVLV